MVPPILEYLGALTLKVMPNVELQLIDGNVNEPKSKELDADLVGISTWTATAPWAYKFGDSLRKLGKKVVFGGIHSTALPIEAKEHADTVVVGEAESVWGDVLKDALKGNLKSFYYGERLPLDDMPFPLTGVLKGNYRFRAVFTARGCPYKCTFCYVRKYFGDIVRYRPIDKVVEEVAKYTGKVYYNGDDNIWGIDIKRSIELFTELSKSAKKWWRGFGDLRTPQEPEGNRLLKAAKDSGLFSVWVGWEASSEGVLKMYHASAKQGKNREEAIKKIKDYGIDVNIFVILGGRSDTAADFEKTVELAERLGVGIHPVLLTPFPGTELYEEYKPYLLKDKGWECYNGVNVLFEHPTMTTKEIEEMYYKVSLRLLDTKRIIKHFFEIPFRSFPVAHLVSLMEGISIRIASGKIYEDWKEEN
jgi:radical SAM superfamily enzyme YgiQ (UPF0313 family)